MTTIWPDPARPGVPLNPEQRGWHWLSCQNMPFLVFWNGEVLQDSLSGQSIKPDVLSPVYSYLGPALTPDEVQERAAQVRRGALEEAAEEMDCACPQRGAVLEKLAKDGPLSHHWPCERSDVCCALRGSAIRALAKGEGDE